jgi:hypothetical protein
MHFLKSLAAFAALATFTMATEEAPVPPQMTLLYSMEALLGERFSLGPIPTGDERIVIPIVGGTFKGPKLNGTLTSNPQSRVAMAVGCRVRGRRQSTPDFPNLISSRQRDDVTVLTTIRNRSQRWRGLASDRCPRHLSTRCAVCDSHTRWDEHRGCNRGVSAT